MREKIGPSIRAINFEKHLNKNSCGPKPTGFIKHFAKKWLIVLKVSMHAKTLDQLSTYKIKLYDKTDHMLEYISLSVI